MDSRDPGDARDRYRPQEQLVWSIPKGLDNQVRPLVAGRAVVGRHSEDQTRTSWRALFPDRGFRHRVPTPPTYSGRLRVPLSFHREAETLTLLRRNSGT